MLEDDTLEERVELFIAGTMPLAVDIAFDM